MKKRNIIACSDIHLRDSVPECRTDDYWTAQWKKFKFIIDTANDLGADICCAGDLFDKAQSSQLVEAMAIKYLRTLVGAFYVIPGQHDLPNHNYNNYYSSSMHVLSMAEVIVAMNTDYNVAQILNSKELLMIHTMVSQDNKRKRTAQERVLDEKSTSARKILRDHKDYDLIITGDNHKPFIEELNGRHLINCGSMMRMRSDQISHKPRIYHVTEKGIKQIFLPIEKGVVDRERVEEEKEQERKFDAFLKRASNEYEIDLSFEGNLEKYFRANRIRKGVQTVCWEMIDEQ